MEKEMKEFIKDMKILLIKLEYEDNKETQMDLVDFLVETSSDFQKKFCD